MPDRDLGDYVTHPWMLVSVGIASVTSGLGFIDPLLGFLTATSGTWFAGLGVLSTLASQLAFLPAGLMNRVFLVGAVAFALIQAYRLWKAADRRFN